MTVKQVYISTLKELQCIRNRAACDHDCTSCPCFNDPKSLEKALQFNLDLLKAKDPMLYLSDDLTVLKEVLKNNVNNQSQET